MTYLVDTGSDISVIKVNKVVKDLGINEKEKCRITGVTDSETYSLGTVFANFKIDRQSIKQKMHIVGQDFPIITDGIIGRDFLRQNQCIIDYETFTILIKLQEEEIVLPMETSLPKQNIFKIPARTEILQALNIKRNSDSIVLSDEIRKGVFICNTLIPKNGVAHIKIINTTEESVQIENFEPKIDSLSDYHVMQNMQYSNNISKEERYKKIIKEINLENNNDYEKQEIFKICREFLDVFYVSGDKLTTNNFYKQEILKEDNVPVFIKNYRLPHVHYEEINKEVKKLIDNDIIEPSVSPYNSPLLVVPKKSPDGNKKVRLVVDFRQLNKKIIGDKFPLTRLEDVLDNMGRAKYFSTLDLTSSFHQIELEKESRHMTAFSTNQGHFQFKRLPFGLKISTNSFQRMLSIALAGLDELAFLYVDDIIVFGCGLTHHNSNLKKVLQRLRSHNLKINPSKCNFLKKEVTYLGHRITDEGVKPDPEKYEVIKNYPRPTDADGTRRFVAFCNYYRKFIRDFALIAKPLNTLLKKGTEFIWTHECEQSFNLLKTKLMNPPILQYPNFEKEFVLTTDASNFTLGAILSQGDVGKDLPIAYASRSMDKHELNKPIIEKELLAIHWAINYFRPYLYGNSFTVITDHRPLVSLFTNKNPSSKMTRIRLDLMDYNFKIIFKQGKLNTNADALSRIVWDTQALKSLIPKETINVVTRNMKKKLEENNISVSLDKPKRETDQLYAWECTSITEVKNLKQLQFKIESLDVPLGELNKNKEVHKFIGDIEKLRKVTVIISNNLALEMDSKLEKLIKRMHELKINKLALKDNDIIFSYMTINEFKEKFNNLQINKVGTYSENDLRILIYKAPKIIVNPEEMLKIIEENHMTPIGGHTGIKRTICKIKQRFVWKNMSKMVKKFINKCELCKKNKIVKHTKEKLVLTETPGSSFEIISVDTVGPLKISNECRYILTLQCELTKYIEAIPMKNKEAITVARAIVEKFILKFGIFKVLKSDMGTEFLNEIMKNICDLLKINQINSTPYHHETLGAIERNHRVLNEYLNNFTTDFNWEEWLPYFVFAYNITPHTETQYTPFELVFGKLASIPSFITAEVSKPIYNFDNYAEEVRFRLREAHKKANNLLNHSKVNKKIEYDKKANPSDFKVGDYIFLKRGNRRKFESNYTGPYEIIERNGVNSKIKIGNEIKEIHNNRLKK